MSSTGKFYRAVPERRSPTAPKVHSAKSQGSLIRIAIKTHEHGFHKLVVPAMTTLTELKYKAVAKFALGTGHYELLDENGELMSDGAKLSLTPDVILTLTGTKNVPCPQGHTLCYKQQDQNDGENWSCSAGATCLCGNKARLRLQALWKCKKCSFDLCGSCHDARTAV